MGKNLLLAFLDWNQLVEDINAFSSDEWFLTESLALQSIDPNVVFEREWRPELAGYNKMFWWMLLEIKFWSEALTD